MIKSNMDMTVVNRILDAKCQKWSKMTDENCHSELRQDVCRYFALAIEGKSLAEAYRELQQATGVGAYILYTQCILDIIMLSMISYEWGKDVADKVRQCLI